MEYDFKPAPEIIASEKVVCGRKLFFLDLKENNRGRFMQITEDVGGRRDRIMLPVEVFDEFATALMRLLAEHKRLGSSDG